MAFVIAFVIASVIAFVIACVIVIATLDQNDVTIGPTSTSGSARRRGVLRLVCHIPLPINAFGN